MRLHNIYDQKIRGLLVMAKFGFLFCYKVFTNYQPPIKRSTLRAAGVCRLRLDNPGIVRATKSTFVVQPVEA